LTGEIEITTGTILGITNNTNLGSDNPAQLAQLSRIIGGTVNASGLHFDLDRGTYYTSLTTTGDLKVSNTVTFAAPNALITAHSIYAEDGAGVINGTSSIELTGNLDVSDDLTFNNSGGLTLPNTTTTDHTIADGKSLIVGPNGSITVGAKLVLNPGAYTAAGLVKINANAGTISTAADASKGLIIAPAPDDTVNGITLFADTAAGATFTATAGTTAGTRVVFSGNGIVVPSDTSTAGAIFAVSGTTTAGAVSVKGTSTITLGAGAFKGTLVLTDGAKIGGDETSTIYTAAHGNFISPPGPGNPGRYDNQATANLLWATGVAATTRVELTAEAAAVDGIYTSTTAQR
jgi:hypothetical protein